MDRFILFVNDYFLGIGRKREYIETIQSHANYGNSYVTVQPCPFTIISAWLNCFKNNKLGVQYDTGKMGIFFFEKVPL